MIISTGIHEIWANLIDAAVSLWLLYTEIGPTMFAVAGLSACK